MSEIIVVVGGQYGSEAKGHVTAQLVNQATKAGVPVVNVRVAGPNAGHTVYDSDGKSFAFRQLPVGAVLGDSDRVVCVIAAGSEIDPPVLFDEIERVKAAGHKLSLLVDENATLIGDRHKRAEADGAMVDRLGSTAKGIGAARAERVWRLAKRVKDDTGLVKQLRAYQGDIDVTVDDTTSYLDYNLHGQVVVIIEGTQGYGLGVHGEHYPQSTSSDCRAIDFLAMAGVSPWHGGVTGTTVVVTCRVYPIRVAGNSGAMKGETTWGALGLKEERTTVTQKVRRVGEWDADLVREAVRANGGGHGRSSVAIALTMVDQKIPELYGFQECTDPDNCPGHPQVTPEVNRSFERLIKQVQEDAGAPLMLVTTGPQTAVWL
jgi:adenylosuccinate synthase